MDESTCFNLWCSLITTVNILQGCKRPRPKVDVPRETEDESDGLHNGLLSVHQRLFTYSNGFLSFVFFFLKGMISESPYARLASTARGSRVRNCGEAFPLVVDFLHVDL